MGNRRRQRGHRPLSRGFKQAMWESPWSFQSTSQLRFSNFTALRFRRNKLHYLAGQLALTKFTAIQRDNTKFELQGRNANLNEMLGKVDRYTTLAKVPNPVKSRTQGITKSRNEMASTAEGRNQRRDFQCLINKGDVGGLRGRVHKSGATWVSISITQASAPPISSRSCARPQHSSPYHVANHEDFKRSRVQLNLYPMTRALISALPHQALHGPCTTRTHSSLPTRMKPDSHTDTLPFVSSFLPLSNTYHSLAISMPHIMMAWMTPNEHTISLQLKIWRAGKRIDCYRTFISWLLNFSFWLPGGLWAHAYRTQIAQLKFVRHEYHQDPSDWKWQTTSDPTDTPGFLVDQITTVSLLEEY